MTSSYLFTNGEAEQVRLHALEALLDRDTIVVLGRLGTHEGKRALEIGAGAGSIARWLSSAVGQSGQVTATDLDLCHLAGADLPSNVELRQHDICSGPVETNAFDLIHARYVLEHVADRDAAVAAMVASLRPGGWLVLETSDPVTAWLGLLNEPAVRALRDAFDRVFDDAGGDSFFGRTLPTAFERHGLVDIEGSAHAQFLPSWSSSQAKAYRLSVDQVAARLVNTGLLRQADLDSALVSLNARRIPFLNHLTIAVWGRRRDG